MLYLGISRILIIMTIYGRFSENIYYIITLLLVFAFLFFFTKKELSFDPGPDPN